MSLDIVIPAHNEEDRIARTLRAYRRGFPQRDVRFLVALDGCEDHTSDIVRDQASEDDRVVLHEFPKLGKGGVLMETFRRCDADLVAFVDADCATPPAELARMTHLASDADGVIASRRMSASFTPCTRRRGRSLSSSGFAWGVRRLFHLPYADTQCGAKVIHRRVAERVVPLMSSRDFLFDVDLLLVADRLGLRHGRGPDGVDRPAGLEAARRARCVAHVEERAPAVDPPPHDARRSGGRRDCVAGPLRRSPSTTRGPAGSLPMRPDVALIAPYPPAGERHGGHSGVASYTANLAHALAAAGLHVEVVAPELEGDPATFADGPIEVRRAYPMGRRALPDAIRAAAERSAARRPPPVRALPVRRAVVADGPAAGARPGPAGTRRRAARDDHAPGRRAVDGRPQLHEAAPRRGAGRRSPAAASPACRPRSPAPARRPSSTRRRSGG